MLQYPVVEALFAAIEAVGRFFIFNDKGATRTVGIAGNGGVHLADNGATHHNVAALRTPAQEVAIAQQGKGFDLALILHFELRRTGSRLQLNLGEINFLLHRLKRLGDVA